MLLCVCNDCNNVFDRAAFLPRGGPDGGDGGRGGNIVFIASESIHTLGLLRNRYTGENGGHGKGKKRHGPNGKDSFVKVLQIYVHVYTLYVCMYVCILVI